MLFLQKEFGRKRWMPLLVAGHVVVLAIMLIARGLLLTIIVEQTTTLAMMVGILELAVTNT